MRLIDIDKLAVCSIDHTDIPTDKGLMVYMADDIAEAPTIKAIPIEVLEELKAEIRGYISQELSKNLLGKETIIELIDRKISEVTE